MRTALQGLIGSEINIIGHIQCFGRVRRKGKIYPNMLIVDGRINGKHDFNHMWVPLNKKVIQELHTGDNIVFKGKVIMYTNRYSEQNYAVQHIKKLTVIAHNASGQSFVDYWSSVKGGKIPWR